MNGHIDIPYVAFHAMGILRLRFSAAHGYRFFFATENPPDESRFVLAKASGGTTRLLSFAVRGSRHYQIVAPQVRRKTQATYHSWFAVFRVDPRIDFYLLSCTIPDHGPQASALCPASRATGLPPHWGGVTRRPVASDSLAPLAGADARPPSASRAPARRRARPRERALCSPRRTCSRGRVCSKGHRDGPYLRDNSACCAPWLLRAPSPQRGVCRCVPSRGGGYLIGDDAQKWPELHAAIRDARTRYQAGEQMPDWQALEDLATSARH